MSLEDLIPPQCKEGDILKYRGRRVGLFACYLEIVGLLEECEKVGVQFEVDIALGLYSKMRHPKGCNWWEYYFEPIKASSSGECHNFNRQNCVFALHACYRMEFERRKEIIRQHIKLLPEVQKVVDDFQTNPKIKLFIGTLLYWICAGF